MAMEVQHQKEDELPNNSMQLLDSIKKEPLDQEPEQEAGPPHEAIHLVLAYLPVLELLVMREACTSLREAVSRDVLPWMDFLVDEPLSSRITDETLVRVASMADGRMRSLALINCDKITDDGLLRVIERNPFISKLHLPGCFSLTSDGVIRAVKTLAEKGNSLEILQIRGIYSIKKQHLEMLLDYVRTNPTKGEPEPVVYHQDQYRTPSRRPIDVEACPKCGQVTMVFDCSREACKKHNQQPFAACRGCKFCVARCEECGGCVGTNGHEPEKALCSDSLCLECWLHLPKCEHCNRPYCRRHAAGRGGDCSSSFVCEVCKVISTINPDYEISWSGLSWYNQIY